MVESASAKTAAQPEQPGPNMIFTLGSIVIVLDSQQKRRMKRCIEKSGSITLSMKEVAVTKLPETMTLRASVIID